MRTYQDSLGNKYKPQQMPEIITDKTTLDRIELMHPVVRDNARKTYYQMCEALTGKAMVRFAYTLRTMAEQDALYQIGRTKLYDNNGRKLGIVTNAKAGMSLHNYGLAFDIVLLTNGGNSASWDTAKDFDGDGESDWMECVNIAKANGWFWGGNFRTFIDKPHFEMRLGYSINDLYRMHQQGRYKDGYLDITG